MSRENMQEVWREIDRIHYAVDKLIKEVERLKELEEARGSVYESAMIELDAA